MTRFPPLFSSRGDSYEETGGPVRPKPPSSERWKKNLQCLPRETDGLHKDTTYNDSALDGLTTLVKPKWKQVRRMDFPSQQGKKESTKYMHNQKYIQTSARLRQQNLQSLPIAKSSLWIAAQMHLLPHPLLTPTECPLLYFPHANIGVCYCARSLTNSSLVRFTISLPMFFPRPLLALLFLFPCPPPAPFWILSS